MSISNYDIWRVNAPTRYQRDPDRDVELIVKQACEELDLECTVSCEDDQVRVEVFCDAAELARVLGELARKLKEKL